MIIKPKVRTLKRFWMLVKSPQSQLRTFQNECAKGIQINGKCIDIGGNKQSVEKYLSLMNIKGNIETLNVSMEHGGGADIIADCNEKLPIEDGAYDTVIAFNLFEHVKNDRFALKEMLRILKNGGIFHINIPIMYMIHGAPFDFHRHSDMWWNETLIELGLRDQSFTIEPLVWDMFATGSSFFETAVKWLRPVIRFFFCLPGALRKKSTYEGCTIGLYISGIKD